MASIPAPVLEAIEDVERETSMGASWALYRIALGVVEASEQGQSVCSILDSLEESIRRAAGPMVPPRWLSRVLREACARGADPGETARRLIDYQSRSIELAVSNASQAIHGAHTIITLSYSTTVERALRQHARRATIIVGESRPGGEGAILASSLQSAGIRVVLVPDTALGRWLGPGSIVLIGADAAGRGGCILNKVGSRLLAHASKSLGVPTYTIFDATKVWPEEDCSRLGQKEWEYEAEAWGTVRTPVFDSVEPEALAGYITEEGILPPGEASLRVLAERLLGSVVF